MTAETVIIAALLIFLGYVAFKAAMVGLKAIAGLAVLGALALTGIIVATVLASLQIASQ